MTKPSKTRKTFTRNNFAEHNYNYVNQSKTNQPPPPKKTQNLNHVCSHYWNLPKKLTISVNFQESPHPPQDNGENYPFFQRNRNKQQTPYYTNYLSSDNDDYHQPDSFAPYTQEYRTQRPRQSQPSQNKKIYPQNPAICNINNQCVYKTQMTHNLFNLYNHKTQKICILTNQLKCKTKYHYHIIYNNMKQQKIN